MPPNNVGWEGQLRWSVMLVSPNQLAAWLQISKRSLYRLSAAGQLPAPVHLRKAVRWRVADIEAWLAAGCPAGSVSDESNGQSPSTTPRSGNK